MTASHSNLELATTILKKLKKELTSETDIIPCKELPFCPTDRFEEFKATFGKRFDDYLFQASKLKNIRAKATSLLPILNGKMAPNVTADIAITLCGTGLCLERSNRLCVELLAAGCKEDINFITTLGKPRSSIIDKSKPEVNSHYTHAFVIIGKLPFVINDEIGLAVFREFNDDCILVDPLLGITGKAKNTAILLKDYFKTYEINRLGEVTTMNHTDHFKHVKTILANAKMFSDLIKRDLGLKEEKTSVNQPTSFPGSPVTASGDAYSSLKKQLDEKLKSYKNIDRSSFANFEKSIAIPNFEQALRRICSFPDIKTGLPLVEILLSFKTQLNIKIDAQGADKCSPIHYAAEQIKEHQNRDLYDLLVRHGADENLLDGDGKSAKQYLEEALKNKPSLD